MKIIKKGIIFILILFCFSIPTFSYAAAESDPVTLTTGLPFFPKDCSEITDTERKELLCYEDSNGKATATYKSIGLIEEVFKGLFQFILGSAGTLCVIMLIVSGLKMAFAAGNANILGAARGRMKDSIIGLILTVSSGFILSIINPQLLDFDIKGPEDFVITSRVLEGVDGSQCVADLSCNYGLYCYKENSDDSIGECREYIGPGEKLEDNEKCIEGYYRDLLTIDTYTYYFICKPEENTKVNDGDLCQIDGNNCPENFYCREEASLFAANDTASCISCEKYYDGTYRNTDEVEAYCLKSLYEYCVFNKECESKTCIGDICVECDDNNKCESNEFCNTTGLGIDGNPNLAIRYKCEVKRSIGQYCENSKGWCDTRLINPCASSGDGDDKFKCY
jgi:hypothetical protein